VQDGNKADRGHPETGALLDALAAACERQFGFIPARVLEHMHYTGTDESGRHNFRDSFTRAYIFLTADTLQAELADRPEKDGSPSWTEALMAHYQGEAPPAQTDGVE